ncbi:MAG: hypothetical protein SVC26_02055 [Pseudomonadota bacterium]|nr:hypothetical protein [Pseudomonadota bacterium]
MLPYRTALADYVTIFTGLSTLAGGIYSLYMGNAFGSSSAAPGYWDGYLQHAIAIAVTVISLYFFLDQSIKMARRIILTHASALPNWLVFGIFYFGGMALFTVFQIVFQSHIFEHIQIAYFITALVIWLAITIPLFVMSIFSKSKEFAHQGRRYSARNEP